MSLATKPKQVEAWLARLPYANPVEASAELTDYLATCVRLRLSADRIEEILEKVMPTAGNLAEALKERIAAEGLPLPPNRQQAAELCARLMLEIGYLCKLIILERSLKRFQLFGAKSVERYVYILMLALKQALEVSLDSHQHPPAGIWLDLHQTYAYALDNGWARAVPAGFGDGPCLEDIYKAALLWVLADPYRIPREDNFATKRVIEEYCHLVDLPRSDDNDRHGSVFAIARDSDTPVIVLSREVAPNAGQWPLLLNTTRLVKRLSLLASQYARENKPGPARPRGHIDDLAYLELLHRLKTQWGGSVQRMGNRRPRYEATRYEVVFGLQGIHKRLSGQNAGQPINLASADGAPAICLLVNDSVGGLALAKERPIGFQLRIGEIAAVRQDSQGQWSIGVIRWFRSTRTGKAIFGMQFLAPGARGVWLRRGSESASLPGLWLPATPSLRQGEMILCQAGRLAMGMNVDFNDEDGQTRHIELEQLAEFTHAVEAYRYREDPGF
jgi:hypothetical protein